MLLSWATSLVSSGNLSAFEVISNKARRTNIQVLAEVVCLFKIWRAFMVSDARLLVLLLMETSQVTLDDTVVLTLKLGDQTWFRLTQPKIEVI